MASTPKKNAQADQVQEVDGGGTTTVEPDQRLQGQESAEDASSVSTPENHAVSTMIKALNNREPSITFANPPPATTFDTTTGRTKESEESPATNPVVVPVESKAADEACNNPVDLPKTSASAQKSSKEREKRSKGAASGKNRKKETKSLRNRRSNKTRRARDYHTDEDSSVHSDGEDLFDTFLDLLWSEEDDDYGTESGWSQDERPSRRRRSQKHSKVVAKEHLEDNETSVDTPKLHEDNAMETSGETGQDFLTEISATLSLGDDVSAAEVGKQVMSGISAAIKIIEEDGNSQTKGLSGSSNLETKSTEMPTPGLLANDQLKRVSDLRSLAQPLQNDTISVSKANTNENDANVTNAERSRSDTSIRGHVGKNVRPIKGPAPYFGPNDPYAIPATAHAANKKTTRPGYNATPLDDVLSQAKESFRKISADVQGKINESDIPGTAQSELEKLTVAFQNLITCNKTAIASQKDGSQNEHFLSTLSKSFSFWNRAATEKSETASRAGATVTSELPEITEQQEQPKEDEQKTPDVLPTPERLKRSQRAVVVEAKDAPSRTFFLTPQKSPVMDSTSSPTTTTLPAAMMTSDSPTSVPLELNLTESWNTATEKNSTDRWEEFEKASEFDKFADTFQVTYQNKSSRWLSNGKDTSSPSGYGESLPEFEAFQRLSLKALSGSTRAEF